MNPKTLKPVVEDDWYVTTQEVVKSEVVAFNAFKVSNVYIIGYTKDGEKSYAFVSDKFTVFSYDNEYEALETLMEAIRSAERVERVVVRAAVYMIKRVRRNKKTGHVIESTYKLVEWEDGGVVYSLELEEDEELLEAP